jgi:hypothetical protein
MSIKARLAKLEHHGMTGGIPVWCDDEADVPATIQAMLAGGEITQSDVSRCVFWAHARCPAGEHERSLEELDRCA